MKIVLVLSAILLLCPVVRAASCPWNAASLEFQGSAIQQAECLLRPIKQAGLVEDTSAQLPISLAEPIGGPVGLDKEGLTKFLEQAGVGESDVGGELSFPLSSTAGDPKLPAKYFVIHDTSFLYACARVDFPAKTDGARDRWNTSDQYKSSGEAHLYITRDGASHQPQKRTFATPWTATRFERSVGKDKVRGRFLHVENVQLRRPNVKEGTVLFKLGTKDCVNDQIAQDPGFTPQQYERLALVYIAASVRAGTWLIPAYHGVLDLGVGTHDDPQNFDLAAWAEQICSLRGRMGDLCPIH